MNVMPTAPDRRGGSQQTEDKTRHVLQGASGLRQLSLELS